MTNGTKTVLVGSTMFAVGAMIGAGVGLLFAPQSGARTRRQLQLLATDAKEKAGQLVEDATHVVKQAIDDTKKLAEQGFEPRRVVGRHS